MSIQVSKHSPDVEFRQSKITTNKQINKKNNKADFPWPLYMEPNIEPLISFRVKTMCVCGSHYLEELSGPQIKNV